MKRPIIILLVIIACLIAFGIYQNSEPSPTSNRGIRLVERLRVKAVEDSLSNIQVMKLDSIANIERKKKEAEEAYKNRPWKKLSPDSEYITFTTKGTFTNSAVKNENLFVTIYVGKKDIGLFLTEYDSSRPAEQFIGDGGWWSLENSNKETLIVHVGEKWGHSEGMLVRNETENTYNKKYDYSSLVRFFKRSEGEIRVYITDDYSSTYIFKIDATGFSKEFDLL